jgi:hypothetical protein
MEITEEILDKHLENFRKQHTDLTAQVHAVSGAIQVIELLKKQLTNDNKIIPSE